MTLQSQHEGGWFGKERKRKNNRQNEAMDCYMVEKRHEELFNTFRQFFRDVVEKPSETHIHTQLKQEKRQKKLPQPTFSCCQD